MFQINSLNTPSAARIPVYLFLLSWRRPWTGLRWKKWNWRAMKWPTWSGPIERTIPTVSGSGRSGKDEAGNSAVSRASGSRRQSRHHRYQAGIAYLAMTSVPEHFIPFRSCACPGIRERDPASAQPHAANHRGRPSAAGKNSAAHNANPRRAGCDGEAAYFLHEEEVPRAGHDRRASPSAGRAGPAARLTCGLACKSRQDGANAPAGWHSIPVV